MVVMRVLIAIAVALVAASAAIAEDHVRVHVDRTTVAANTEFRIDVEASGESVGEPIFDDPIEGLTVRPKPIGQSQSVQWSTGKGKTVTKSLSYAAVATKVGEVKLPPVGVPVNGKLLYSKPVTLNVVAETQPQRGLAWEDIIIVTSRVDKSEVYQGEQLVLTLEQWIMSNESVEAGTFRGADIRYPDTSGFYTTPLTTDVIQRTRNGWSYDVTEYRQVLYATTTGDLVIGPWYWEGLARARTRYGVQQKTYNLQTSEIHVKVKPLPEGPPNFSGAVGRFTLNAELARDEVIQGVPTTLIVRVSGEGNPDAIGEPHLPPIENAYLSDAEKETAETKGSGLLEKRFTYMITPLKPGNMMIPPVEFCYFDPQDEEFKTEAAGPFTLRVLESVESGPRTLVSDNNVDSPSHAVGVIDEDIRPLAPCPDGLRPSPPAPLRNAGAVAFPAVAYLAAAMLVRRKRRFEQDSTYTRAYHAKAACLKRLRAVRASAQPADDIYRTLAAFIADEFDVPEAGMTGGGRRAPTPKPGRRVVLGGQFREDAA